MSVIFDVKNTEIRDGYQQFIWCLLHLTKLTCICIFYTHSLHNTIIEMFHLNQISSVNLILFLMISRFPHSRHNIQLLHSNQISWINLIDILNDEYHWIFQIIHQTVRLFFSCLHLKNSYLHFVNWIPLTNNVVDSPGPSVYGCQESCKFISLTYIGFFQKKLYPYCWGYHFFLVFSPLDIHAKYSEPPGYPEVIIYIPPGYPRKYPYFGNDPLDIRCPRSRDPWISYKIKIYTTPWISDILNRGYTIFFWKSPFGLGK